MQTIVIVIHLMIVVALVGVVLLQRSEGGGLGIGGGSGFMTARGAANALTRTTGILAAGFFATSLALALLSRYGDRPLDILDRVPQENGAPVSPGAGGVLNQLGGSSTTAPAAPDNAQPPTAADTQPSAPATGTQTAPAAPATQPAEGASQTAPAGQGGTAVPNQ